MKPDKRIDNFSTFLKVVEKKTSPGGGVSSEQAPMKILDVLAQHDGSVELVDLSKESGIPLTSMVLALNDLKKADVVVIASLDGERVSLTPTGRTIANFALADALKSNA